MLEKAVNAGIYRDPEDETLHAISVPINDVEFGQQVKVIVLKDEK